MSFNCYGQALIAKARGIYGKGIGENEYNELIHKRTVADVATYLKTNTRYKFVLEGIKDSSVHRGQLEAMVSKNIFYEYTKLLKYVPQGEEGYFSFPKLEAEIEQILSKLRYLKSGDKQVYISELPIFIKEHLSFDIIEFAKAETVQEALNVLKKTEYYDTLLKVFREEKGEALNYLKYERALYSYYYKEMCDKVSQFYGGDTRELLLKFFEGRRDMENIISALRLRKYYNCTQEQVRELLLTYDKLQGKGQNKSKMKKQLEKILLAKTEKEVVAALQQTGYVDKPEEADITQIEKDFDMQAYKMCKKQMSFSTNAAIVYTAFLLITKIETDNIITIIEGVRYGIAPEKIKSMLRM